MSQLSKPCCDNVLFEMVDAPRTEGAVAPADVIRCASCGSAISSQRIATARQQPAPSFIFGLAEKIGRGACR